MTDELVQPAHGPDSYWSDTMVPSRGQYRTIAVLALDLLGVEVPAHRLDASIVISATIPSTGVVLWPSHGKQAGC